MLPFVVTFTKMKIQRVTHNNHRKAFEVFCRNHSWHYPYSRLQIQPAKGNVISDIYIDTGSDKRSFTYVLQSGDAGTVHIDHVLDYNHAPTGLRMRILDTLTNEARKRIEDSQLSKREIVRRLGTSASQLYRIVDPDNQRKSIDQVLLLLEVLDCNVNVTVEDRGPIHVGNSTDGVDVSLIRWTLSLTPAERLRALQQHVNSVLRLRNG